MNIIITEKCNKFCDFCFTPKEEKIQGKEMSLEVIQNILTNYTTLNHYKILGGEPTLHSEFSKVLELFKGKQASLMTNLLFDEKIFNMIENNIQIFWYDAILVNGMELEKNNRLDIWLDNFIKFKNLNYSCCVAITITKKNINDIIDYIKMLYDKTKFIYLRVGIDIFENAEWIINNKLIGKVFKEIVNFSENKFDFNTDCIVPSCINNRRESWTNMNCPTEKYPIDIFQDSVNICYPTKSLVGLDRSEKPINEKIIRKKLAMKLKKIDIKLPKECYKCNDYKSNICKGICLGALNKKDNMIGEKM